MFVLRKLRVKYWALLIHSIDLLKTKNCVYVTMVFRKCIYCDSEFEDIFNKRVCSTKCAVEALHNQIFN